MMSELAWISIVLLWVTIVFMAVVLWALARQIGALQRRISPTGARIANVGLELGEEAPWFNEQDTRGLTVTPGWQRYKPTLLVFTSVGCTACEALYPTIPTLLKHESGIVEIAVIGLQADSPGHQAYAVEHGLDRVPYLMSPEVAEAYEVTATPYAILVDAEGKVYTKGIANTLEHLESLINALDSGYPSFDAMMSAQVEREKLDESTLTTGVHHGDLR